MKEEAQFNPVYPKVKKRNSLDVIMWCVFENIITPVAWPFWGYCDTRSSLRLLVFLIAPEEALYIRQLYWNIFCSTIVSLFTSSSLCRHDQFAVIYFWFELHFGTGLLDLFSHRQGSRTREKSLNFRGVPISRLCLILLVSYFSSHWYLAVICFAGHTEPTYINEILDEDEETQVSWSIPLS